MKPVVYQIYTFSFKDSSNKGTGDLKGIKEKLSYIKNLGVDYVWVTPFFKSNFKDNGYDVIDYYNVDHRFGTNEDLIELIKEAKKHSLKIMLDMVFNHTSTDCEWFKGWIRGDLEYKDFYISKVSKNGPPTNWLSKFGGSAWAEYKPNHWYLHLFDKTQADLNWENPKVRQKIKDVIRHYIKLGINGFRFDVINLVSKGEYKDDLTGDGRKYYTDGPRIHEFIQELNQEFPKNNDFLTVGEMSSTNIEDAIKYANKNKTELHSVFTFHHLKVDYTGLDKFIAKTPDIKELSDVLSKWVSALSDAESSMALFFNNHDQPRSVTRFINSEYRETGAKMLFAFISSMPGIPYIYQGEEIGMTNPGFEDINEYRDVETLNYFKTHNLTKATLGIKQKSRDNSRTPFQWDASKNAGFTKGTPWINVCKNYKEINVEKQDVDPNSVLNFYKSYIKFIKSDEVLLNGKIKFLPYKDLLISYEITYKQKTYRFAFSFSNNAISYNFNKSKIIKSNESLENNKLKPYQFIIELIA